MFSKLHNLGRSVWRYADSNVGSVLIGATISYVLTKGSTEEELNMTKQKLDKTEEQLITLEEKLKKSDEKMFNLLNSKLDISLKLQNCERKKAFIKYRYNNSFCLFGNNYSDEPKNEKNTEPQLKGETHDKQQNTKK